MTLTAERAEIWKDDVAPIVLIASDPRRVIARVYERNDANRLVTRYNAHPELLAACKQVIQSFDDAKGQEYDELCWDEFTALGDVNVLRAAITNATKGDT